MDSTFSELGSLGVIAVRGADAAAFLHGQLTSDIASMRAPRTQYSGYCSPKGRLLATLLVWQGEDEILLFLPEALRAGIQARLSKYILRAQVKLADATTHYRLFGVWGSGARNAVAALAGRAPEGVHEVVSSRGLAVARLPVERYMVIAQVDHAAAVRTALSARAQEEPEDGWSRLDIEAGIAVVSAETQEEYVPQMLNLDLIGAVSYTKGCYPGQEIVARTHYLGRLKQRMYRVRLPAGDPPVAGDALYSAAFGAEQASGAVLNAVPAPDGGYVALAVIQKNAGTVHWKTPDGPAIELHSLPYSIPD